LRKMLTPRVVFEQRRLISSRLFSKEKTGQSIGRSPHRSGCSRSFKKSHTDKWREVIGSQRRWGIKNSLFQSLRP
jgi:hypothetical protein